MEVTSLVYREPGQNLMLEDMLKRIPGRVSIIVGLRDRVGMMTGREWHQSRAQAPRLPRIYIDPKRNPTLP